MSRASEFQPQASARNGTCGWLLAFLALSLALRLWFAIDGLNPGRFYDERYTLGNVAGLLDGELRPVYGWYPSLSYLPQAALLGAAQGLYEATGLEWLEIRTGPKRRFTSTAYLICRSLQCVYGVLSLWLAFLVGRWLMPPAWALLGGFLLSVTPVHIRFSASVKPDMLMLVMVLVVFLVALRTLDRPTWRRYLLGGLSIGVMASAKPYAAPAALPLAVAALAQPAGRSRQLLRLAMAALVSLALFVALNPFLPTLWHYAQLNARTYAAKGEGHLSMLSEGFRLLLGPGIHGPIIGGLGLIGIALWAWTMVRSERGAPTRARIAMVVVLFVGYLAFGALVLPWVKANLMLPLVPFTALGAAWTASTVWRLAAGRLSKPGRRLLAGAATMVLAWTLASSLHAVYRMRVPSTYSLAAARLRSRLPEPLLGRLVYVQEPAGERLLPGFRTTRGNAAAVVRFPDLSRLDPTVLDRSDAEIFPVAALEGETGGFYSARTEGSDSRRESLVIRPRLLRSRGPVLRILLHPWRALPVERLRLTPVAGDRHSFGTRIAPPKAASGEIFASLDVRLPTRGWEEEEEEEEECRLIVAGSEVPMHRVGIVRDGVVLFSSERFSLSGEETPLQVRLARPQGRRSLRVRVHFWQAEDGHQPS